MKKLIALVLALAMVAAVGLASAAQITITDKNPDGTATTEFHYYGLLKATVNGNKVAYYLDNPADETLKDLLDAVKITKGGSEIDVFTFTASSDGTRWNVSVNASIESTDGEAIATALNTAAIKAAAFDDDTFTMSNGTAQTADTLVDGYYLVTSSLGAKLVLDTFKVESIVTKNDYHTTVKTGSMVDMNVGDKITYTITVHVPENAIVGDTITVHDTLDSHLAILNSSEAIAATASDYYITAAVGATAVDLTAGTLEDGETFAKSFNITNAMLNQNVILTYKAELLSTAADDTGYVNTVYSNTSTYETNPSRWRVYTFDIDLDKSFQGVQSTDQNAGSFSATFELRTDADDDSTAYSFKTISGGYEKVDSDDTGSSTDLVVTAASKINIKGLKAGTYYLVETATTSGYNLLTAPIAVTITDTTATDDKQNTSVTPTHSVSYTYNGTTATGDIRVTNNSGTELPSTGGIGTTIFYILGGLLVVGAAVILVARRKASN